MSIDLETAEKMKALYETARDSAPLRQIRGEMNARAREWRHAIEALEDMGDGWTIELVGAVVPYMRCAGMSADGRMEGQVVDRVLHRDGGVALAFTDPLSGRAVYVNFISAASPAAVKA